MSSELAFAYITQLENRLTAMEARLSMVENLLPAMATLAAQDAKNTSSN